VKGHKQRHNRIEVYSSHGLVTVETFSAVNKIFPVNTEKAAFGGFRSAREDTGGVCCANILEFSL